MRGANCKELSVIRWIGNITAGLHRKTSAFADSKVSCVPNVRVNEAIPRVWHFASHGR